MRAVAASSASGGAGGAGVRLRLGRLVGRRRRDDELGLAAAQAQLDRAGRELARDLVGGGRQRVEQHQPDRRVERGGQPLGERAGVLAAGGGGDGELATEVLDVLRQVHGTTYGTSHGAMSTPSRCHVAPTVPTDRLARRRNGRAHDRPLARHALDLERPARWPAGPAR